MIYYFYPTDVRRHCSGRPPKWCWISTASFIQLSTFFFHFHLYTLFFFLLFPICTSTMVLRVHPRPFLLPLSLPRLAATRFAHSAPQAPTRNCPSCSRPVPLPLSPCPSCSSILPLPSNLSHHSMLYLSSPISSSGSPAGPFDIPQELSHLPSNGYIVDKADLRSNWVRRQRELHPDKYTTRGDGVVDLARELSGRVNEAYAVLGDDLRRAEYIVRFFSFLPNKRNLIITTCA